MNYGYTRLSKDDNKQDYISIENQMLIISQYVKEMGDQIDQWYEDDGISGYKFNRPGLNEMLEMARPGDTIYAKDLSRIGRHNAKVLLLIEQLKEDGIRLFMVDERYDSENSDDDMLGITTWYNEKYIKNTSRKIKQVLHARQKEGTLYHNVPFGYIRDQKDKSKILIVPEEAEYIKKIFEYYIQGYGYRRIANILNENKIETPSECRRKQELINGIYSKKRVASRWTDSMVHDILKNDIYIGNFRLHKKTRHTIHGKDIRVPKENQYLFEANHEPIISKEQFELVQEIMGKRIISNYRGGRVTKTGQQNKIENPFGNCLFCKACGRKLTPIVRTSQKGIRKYYICSTYNTKGREYCSKSHLIEESALMEDMIQYLKMCRNLLSDLIENNDLYQFKVKKDNIEKQHEKLIRQREEIRKQMQVILEQKVKDITALNSDADSSKMIQDIYQDIQSELLRKVQNIERQLEELEITNISGNQENEKLNSALDILDSIIKKKTLDRTDIEILIERIDVDENGMPAIEMKFGLSESAAYDSESELNRKENEIICNAMKVVSEEERTFTSAKRLSVELEKRGIEKSLKAVMPYLNFMIHLQLIKPTDNPQKPYDIIASKQEIQEYITKLHSDCPTRWYA